MIALLPGWPTANRHLNDKEERQEVRSLLAALTLTAAILLSPLSGAAAAPAYNTQLLNLALTDTSADTITSGALDAQFTPYEFAAAHRVGKVLWFKLKATSDYHPTGVPVLVIRKGRYLDLHVFTNSSGTPVELPLATTLPQFRGAHEVLFVVAAGMSAGQSFYVRVECRGTGYEGIHASNATLGQSLAHAVAHARMIQMTFGALMALALAVLLVWFVLSDPLLIYYSMVISTQALYVAYFTGQAFEWPLFSYAVPLASYAWNVPIAISATFACLFVREITDLKHVSPHTYRIFGWLAISFVVLAFANLADLFDFGGLVAVIGNCLFLGAAIFTMVVAFIAWRRGSRAAGWFLIAWGLLEVFIITTTVSLLIASARDSDLMLYYGLPLSMVAAATLMALGVADRLREQRRALTDAERRAQTDPLTGVLNRRSFLERLDAACARAQTRDLPIALLFIDLDHFKQINDTYGHLAGDACLKAIIAPIHAELRQSDVIGRYGGEEFVVLLSSADAVAAHPIAERILKRVADIEIEGFGATIRLTCSIGVAASDLLGVWGESLIAHADAAVYAAKLSGRNRVRLAALRAAEIKHD